MVKYFAYNRRLHSTLCVGFLGSFAFLLGACKSYTDKTKEVRQAYQYANYTAALNSMEETGLQSSEPLLYLLEKALILDRMKELKKGRKDLMKADQLVDELFTVSLSKEAVSFVYNDSAQDYSGEDYEKVAIHIMLALSFLEDGLVDSALVEARKINSRLNEINSEYGSNKNRYSQDAFARYLSGLIYQSKGEWDSAIIDYKKALDLYSRSYRLNFAMKRPPRDLVNSLHRLLLKRDRASEATQLQKEYTWLSSLTAKNTQKTGELVVVHELGLIAPKKAYDFLIPLGKEIHRLSFPIIEPQSPFRFGKTGVLVTGQGFSAANLVQDMDQIAAKTLEDRRLRLVAKQAARLIIKSQINQKARQELGPLGGLAVNVFNAITETADTRGWNLLPSAFYLSRVSLAPGSYQVQVYTNGRLQQVKSVKVKEGEIQFLRSFD